MIAGIHHVALILKDEKSLQFYERLGFEQTFVLKREQDMIVLLSGHGMQLEVFVDPRHSERAKGMAEPLGLRHIAFKVDDIEIAAKEYDIAIGPIRTDWTGIRLAFFEDPEGTVLELHE